MVTLENIAIINSGTSTTRRVSGNGLIINEEDLDSYLIFTETGIKKYVASYSFEKTVEGLKCTHIKIKWLQNKTLKIIIKNFKSNLFH
jgi:hypothetical protein